MKAYMNIYRYSYLSARFRMCNIKVSLCWTIFWPIQTFPEIPKKVLPKFVRSIPINKLFSTIIESFPGESILHCEDNMRSEYFFTGSTILNFGDSSKDVDGRESVNTTYTSLSYLLMEEFERYNYTVQFSERSAFLHVSIGIVVLKM